jgi:hypothetical protein
MQGLPVLIHGSSGFDLEATISSLTQILLDPLFRTFTGFAAMLAQPFATAHVFAHRFCQLIEKEWLHMGHPFAERCALHADPSFAKFVLKLDFFLIF